MGSPLSKMLPWGCCGALTDTLLRSTRTVSRGFVLLVESRGDSEELTCDVFCLPVQGFAWILMGFPKLAQMIINITS
ncbi:hypothetical protein QQF64_019226 [Cirrhinus molitorella]|uniref:Uncharacterized protein n=2 Tax=Cirrhinus molitorella TaxID=172907 RepID=A0ABR3LG92_9TELE|nr:hypothetical protein Q8A67_005867 [Cirrhinus molitorella]